jgi:type IV pilus biogenesis protein CpaD/CtpE
VLGCAALGGLARAVAAPQDLLGRPAVVVVEPPPE